MRPIVTDGVVSSVGRSVTLVSRTKTAEPIEMPFGLSTRVGPGNHILHAGRDPTWEGAIFRGRKGRPTVKYRDTLWSCVQKWLNRSRCRLGCGLGWAQGIVLDGGPDPRMRRGNLGENGRPL